MGCFLPSRDKKVQVFTLFYFDCNILKKKTYFHTLCIEMSFILHACTKHNLVLIIIIIIIFIIIIIIYYYYYICKNWKVFVKNNLNMFWFYRLFMCCRQMCYGAWAIQVHSHNLHPCTNVLLPIYEINI